MPSLKYLALDIQFSENSGISASIQKKLIFLYIDEQLSYNTKYRRSFTPQIRNVLKMNIPLTLFKGALKLDPYLIYHYIGTRSCIYSTPTRIPD